MTEYIQHGTAPDYPPERYVTHQAQAEVIMATLDEWQRLTPQARLDRQADAAAIVTDSLATLVAKRGHRLVPHAPVAVVKAEDDYHRPPTLPNLHVVRLIALATTYDPDDPQ